MRLLKTIVVLLVVVLMVAGLWVIGCGGDDDCDKCCKCTCTSSSISFSGDCMDCEDVCTNGMDVPILGHLDGCGEELESFEAFKDASACD